MKKLVALLLAVLTVLTLFAGCGKTESAEVVLPVQNVPETIENRYKAIAETALAYYHKNPYSQYDNTRLSVLGNPGGCRYSGGPYNAPEYATSERNVYNVCTAYAYHVMYNAFNTGWDGENPDLFIYYPSNEHNADKVFEHVNDPNDMAANEAAAAEARKILQFGDFVAYGRYERTGHVAIWCDDLDFDGDIDVINQDGSYYEESTGEEFKEPLGGTDLNTDRFYCPDGEYFFFNPACSQYLPKQKNYAVYRFTDNVEDMPMTEPAKTRVLFPGLVINYTTDRGAYGSVVKGQQMTYTLELTNKSQQNHEGILVQIPVPANSKLIAVNGKPTKGAMVKFTANIAAGDTVTATITVQATGEVGSVVLSEGAYVHCIPLPVEKTVIASAKVDAAAVKAAAEKHAGKTDAEFINAVYAELGADVQLPAIEAFRDATYKLSRLGDYKLYNLLEGEDVKDAKLSKMLVPDFHGGQYLRTPEYTLRVKDVFAKDLEAGDMLVWQETAVSPMQVAVHDGENLLWVKDGTLVPMDQPALDKFLVYRWFTAIRPLQGM